MSKSTESSRLQAITVRLPYAYTSKRAITKLCETDIRFLWLPDEAEPPSHITVNEFLRKELAGSLQDIFDDINRYVFSTLHVDLNHAYIDGTKLEANANKYTWVLKKNCITSRNKTYGKVSALLEEMNRDMVIYERAVFESRQEYTVEYVKYILSAHLNAVGLTEASPVYGKGKHKSTQHYGADSTPRGCFAQPQQYSRCAAADKSQHSGRWNLWWEHVEPTGQTAAAQRDRRRNFGVRLNILRF